MTDLTIDSLFDIIYYIIGDIMNETLDKLFFEKNKEILKNKLVLDVSNNTDSLKLTLSNVVMLEMNKLYKSLVKLFEENDIEYSDDKLKALIEEEKLKLNDIILKGLSHRQDLIEKHVKEGDN